EEDLDLLKSAVLRGQALKNETLSAKLGVLRNISTYGYPDNYQAINAQRVEEMTLEQFKELADEYLRPDAMQYVIVGDAASQAGFLSELGFGEPIMLEKEE
ncbi:MAG: insulinase family protein, partial [Proteobacteria bacterium]|nr:insulinase family protein [Pseudomonadota bacterium]